MTTIYSRPITTFTCLTVYRFSSNSSL